MISESQSTPIPRVALPGRSPTILLVDDDSGVRESIGRVLESEGYNVISAPNAGAAEWLANREQFDLVILDIKLPDKSGWETFEFLTREYPLVSIIMITGEPAHLFTAVSAGAGALMEKPLDIGKLLGVIRELLAEPTEARVRRLAGVETVFHFVAANAPKNK